MEKDGLRPTILHIDEDEPIKQHFPYQSSLENVRAMAEAFNQNKNEYQGNKDGSLGFSAKKNRDMNKKEK